MLLIKVKPGCLASLTAFTTCAVSALALGGLGQAASLAQTQAAVPLRGSGASQPAPDPQQVLESAQEQVRSTPDDAKARFALAEALRRLNRPHDAGEEYLRATELDPQFYVAFHQLSTINADPTQLDEAISRLTKLKEEKPKELMLRVALSELFERRGRYYQGARVLVDLVYSNSVPDKYLPRVNARIHYLLAKSKDTQEADKGVSQTEELDTLPPPLPEATLQKDLAASRLKESRVSRGVGNAPLLP